VPTRSIVEGLAYINWTILVGLAVGCFAAVVALRLTTGATRGYLAFSAFLAVLLGGLALFADGGLAPAPTDLPVPLDPVLDGARRLLLIAFVVFAMLETLAIAAGRRSAPVAVVGVLFGVGTLVAAGLGWAGLRPAGVPAAIRAVSSARAGGPTKEGGRNWRSPV